MICMLKINLINTKSMCKKLKSGFLLRLMLHDFLWEEIIIHIRYL
jgi:hypothetical protein